MTKEELKEYCDNYSPEDELLSSKLINDKLELIEKELREAQKISKDHMKQVTRDRLVFETLNKALGIEFKFQIKGPRKKRKKK
jgi:hypothetical protein